MSSPPYFFSNLAPMMTVRSGLASSTLIFFVSLEAWNATLDCGVYELGMPSLANPQASTAFQASKETKKISIDESNPEHTVIIGAGLDEE